MYSKNEVIKLFNRFDSEVNALLISESKNGYNNTLSLTEIKEKWIEENV